jgi:hypothetical protein
MSEVEWEEVPVATTKAIFPEQLIEQIAEADDKIAYLEARLSEAVKVIEMFMHSVCHETGFANAVRHDSGHAYPWPALDQTEAAAKAFITTLGGEE